jgi:hypothetical protein
MSDERQKTLTGEPEFSKDTIRRIRKLRWAGMDNEVEGLLKELKPRPADVEVEAVLPTRLETD